ncbi:hypothetical protein C1H46_029269 [Malus baccata]|uniref:Uncharacterized protein n=1 Tax=Malus baccata TaxID=106549 RepID=A0A540LFC6_MALBA|nr:hypothetical protein C1H46_029269 [Malus baccata]
MVGSGVSSFVGSGCECFWASSIGIWWFPNGRRRSGPEPRAPNRGGSNGRTRAFRGFFAGPWRMGSFRDFVAFVAAGKVGAVDELVRSVTEGLVGEGFRWEEVPRRRSEVVDGQCLDLNVSSFVGSDA